MQLVLQDLLLKKDSVSIGLSFNFSGSSRKFGGSLSKYWDKQLRVCKTVTVNDREEVTVNDLEEVRNISANNTSNILAISTLGKLAFKVKSKSLLINFFYSCPYSLNETNELIFNQKPFFIPPPYCPVNNTFGTN